ncbi:MAG TPA: cytochrome c3 family protein [Thermoanaerobaculia bacterium]|nr:cytochrome c3 family protein [Thermoanaerobaculia bacterium]
MKAFLRIVCLLAMASAVLAKNGAYKMTAHGSADRGPQRSMKFARGSCVQCHSGHGSHEPGNPRLGLFAPNDNELCFVCHASASEDGLFPGRGLWMQATHALSQRVAGGGSDPRRPAMANACVNCHDPHGVKDQNGVIPAMLHAREPEVCLACHDGSRGADIRSETLASVAHGTGARGAHDPHEGSDVGGRNQTAASNRHVSCSDCHNVHRAAPDRIPVTAPEASARLSGVSRVRVLNGAAGSVPAYVFVPAGDLETAQEFEICFKCHSSFIRQAPQQPNLAQLTNPANASFHPIQAEGKNRNIHPDAFVSGWDARSRVSCTDCHGSENARVRGPHGSRFEFLLKKQATASTSRQSMQRDNLCFDCHAWAVYGDATSAAATLAASRFSAHALHVDAQRVPCYACHETHGSARNAALIATGRGMIVSYTQTPAGGSCNSTCHAQKSYAASYSR